MDLLRTAEDLAWLLDRVLLRLRRQAVAYAEIRVSPTVWERHGLSPESGLEALLKRRQASPVAFNLIVDAVRQWDRRLVERDLELALAYRNRGVVALGLGGDEAAAPASLFGALAARCRAEGLPVIPHAGEALGPEEVAEALRVFEPLRLGHGIAAARDPRVVAELVRRRVHLEVCPTSNLRTGVVRRAADHPLGLLWSRGVSLSLGTDDPALFRTTLAKEQLWASRHAGWTIRDFGLSQVAAARAALLPRVARAALVRRVETAWAP